jgi:hypothetical protein
MIRTRVIIDKETGLLTAYIEDTDAQGLDSKYQVVPEPDGDRDPEKIYYDYSMGSSD